MGWSGQADDSQQAAAGLLARARAGDMAAAQQLQQATQTWAPNHRNAAIDAWNQLNPSSADDLNHIKNPHHGLLGAVGSVFKVAAPFAGLIPGVGPLIGAGLAAGGSALGGAMHGDKFNLLDTLLAGGAGYAGGKLNPFGGHGGPAGLLPSGAGNATQMGGGVGSALGDVGNANVGSIPGLQYFPGLPQDPGMSAGGGGGSILDRLLGRGGGGGGGGILDKLLQYGPLVAGGISAANRQHEADQMMQNAVRGAQGEWDARAPLRQMAMSSIMGLPGLKAPDLSHIFADSGNPYYRSGN